MSIDLATKPHDHKGAYQIRAFVGMPGLWVNRYGEWCRPVHVWLYRGAWRAACFPCARALPSDNPLFDYGYPTQAAAFDAAHDHCRACTTRMPAANLLGDRQVNGQTGELL